MNPQNFNPNSQPPAPQPNNPAVPAGAPLPPAANLSQPAAPQMTQPAPTVQPMAAATQYANAPGMPMPAAQVPQPNPAYPQMAPGQPMMNPATAAPGVPMQAMPGQPQAITGQPQAAAENTVAAPHTVENPLSTQATLLFSELRDGLIIMKDGSFRAVVACQSINFDLMSEQEREGVEYSYQNFLNSLNFTIQILVRSQRVDISPYIDKLSKIRRNNDNMLLGILMDDYINFIDELAREANIMDKSFFIVIPYYPSADIEKAVEDTKNFFRAINKNKNQGVTRINRDVYDKAVDELNNRVETVIAGLYQIGIQSIRLHTRELSQLFYNFNNPDTAVREPLVDFSQMATTYVRKGTKS